MPLVHKNVTVFRQSGYIQRFPSNHKGFPVMITDPVQRFHNGNENFSIRFYEALSTGRVPVYINTGTPIPDISPLRWEDHILTIELGDINQIPKRIEGFLKDRTALEIIKTNRALWRERLSMVGFWKNEINRIKA